MAAEWEKFRDALLAAKFTEDGFGQGYVRLGWPDGRGTLMVPTDPTAPEYGELIDAVMSELEAAERRGEKATEVLERLQANGAIA